jgi:ATP-binding cassette subfamily B protein
MEHGRVIDRGPHAELLERSEGYRNLVNAYERAEAEQEALAAEETAAGETAGEFDEREEAVR